MKKSILKVLAALVFAVLMINYASPLFKIARFGWISSDSLSLRRNFYFGRGQWLADGRTIIAAIRFLYQSSFSNPADTMSEVSAPDFPVKQPQLSTNLLVDGRESGTTPHAQRLFARERLIVLRRRLPCPALSGSVVFADYAPLSPHGPAFSNGVMNLRVMEFRPSSVSFVILPTNAASPWLRIWPAEFRATNLRGA